jgi:hypothetical protein
LIDLILWKYLLSKKKINQINKMASINVYKVNTYTRGNSEAKMIYCIKNTNIINIPINSNETLTHIGVMNPDSVMQYDIISNVDVTGFNYFEDYDNFDFSNDGNFTEKKDKVVTYEEAYKMCMKFK